LGSSIFFQANESVAEQQIGRLHRSRLRQRDVVHSNVEPLLRAKAGDLVQRFVAEDRKIGRSAGEGARLGVGPDAEDAVLPARHQVAASRSTDPNSTSSAPAKLDDTRTWWLLNDEISRSARAA
jgi:hypothetical protein